MISVKTAIYHQDLSPQLCLDFLSQYLGKDKGELFLNLDLCFEEAPFLELLNRFKNGEPYEYIFKKASFYGLDFFVEKGVLIPRFDTEILLELCLREITQNDFKNILEIGFGSGILSIVLAKLTGVKITAVDISKKALECAFINAKRHGVLKLIDFKLMDFKKLDNEFDFIFSNPPYISLDYELDSFVKAEPKEALYGGKKGHELLSEIITFAKKSRLLACEIGYDQKEVLSSILEKEGFSFSFFKDLAHHDRAFVAKSCCHKGFVSCLDKQDLSKI